MINKQPRQVKTTNLKKRFIYWAALILFSGGLILSAVSYWNTRRLLMEEAMTKSEVILREAEAIRSYVKEDLRPKMVELHGQDAFIIEAMSSTYISTTIMKRFAQAMPDHTYRRVSRNPHNRRNMADSFEENMFEWFEEDKDRSFWQGIVTKNDESYFISMVPDYFTESCIRCHGKPDDAPDSLLDRYGRERGFGFKAGDLGGINSVAIPVSASLREALQGSVVIFVSTFGSSIVLLCFLYFLFNRLVIERLGEMLTLVDKKESTDADGPGDELDSLQASVGSLSRYVRSARKGSFLEPNFIGDYVVTNPVLSGAMSWLYSGYSSTSQDQAVSLKIGFNETLQNPLYRACYDAELHLFETHTHPCLPKVVERIDDILIFEEIKGTSLQDLMKEGTMNDKLAWTVFGQLCDLVSSFHAAGIVHHDLRPHNFMIDNQQNLCLMDMGLAAGDRQVDPITAAGLSPQGDGLYMAPEQIQGKRGDPRSDIYTLGMNLYLATTGKAPFARNQKSPVHWLRQKREVPSPLLHRKDMSPALAEVILKALAYDPDKRYQWVEDLWEDLKNHGPA